MSSGILTSRKQKNLLSKNSLKNPSHATISCFKTYRNLYNQVIKTAKKLYYEKQLTINQKNLRKTWQILFSSIHKEKKNKDDLSHLTINGLHISDPRLMATHFNAFFTSIASKTVQDINPSNISPTELIVQNPNLFSLSNNILTKKEILEATKLLKDKNHLIILAFPLILSNKLYRLTLILFFTFSIYPSQQVLCRCSSK